MPVDAENLTGTAIEGGTSRAVAKGDIIIVPENTPHWYSRVNGTLILMSFHVPRPVPPLTDAGRFRTGLPAAALRARGEVLFRL